MELPLWLSKGLYERNRKVLSIELPKVYREGWRTVFNADPNVVDLHKMGPYYYGLGSQILHFDNPENTEIGQTLLQVSIICTVTFLAMSETSFAYGICKSHFPTFLYQQVCSMMLYKHIIICSKRHTTKKSIQND